MMSTHNSLRVRGVPVAFSLFLLCVTPGGAWATTCSDGNSVDWDGCTDGQPSELTVNRASAGPQHAPAMAALSDGSHVVLWVGPGEGGGTDIYGRVFNPDGTAATLDFKCNSYLAQDQYEPVVAHLEEPGNHFLAVWTSNLQDGSGMGIMGRKFNPDGTPAGSEFHVNQHTLNDQVRPSVAALNDGRFVVTWQSWKGVDAQFDVAARIFVTDDHPAGDEFLAHPADSQDQLHPAVAAWPGGEFAIVYGDDSYSRTAGIWVSVFDDVGNTEPGWSALVSAPIVGILALPSAAAMEAAGERTVVVSFAVADGGGATDVAIRRYDIDSDTGVPVPRDVVTVNEYAIDEQSRPGIAATGDRLVAAWQSDYQDGSRFGIYGRLYGLDTSPIGLIPFGGEFQVNTFTTLEQQAAAVASFKDGRFGIVWEGYDQDGDDFGIFAQLLRRDGAKLWPCTANPCQANQWCKEGTCQCVCPDGTLCYAGGCCEPDCEGKNCGDDGCGGVCGDCGPQYECQEGQCACVPDCELAECGNDGCEGSCGECGLLHECFEGGCICSFEACGTVCCQNGESCWEDACCLPQCDGLECGDDGCGGSCGECPELMLCGLDGMCQCQFEKCGSDCCGQDAVCVADACCQPQCQGKECGSDDCGGSCGDCAAGEECYDGLCCLPDCTGKECGPNGCGESCWESPGEECDNGVLCDGTEKCEQGECVHDLDIEEVMADECPIAHECLQPVCEEGLPLYCWSNHEACNDDDPCTHDSCEGVEGAPGGYGCVSGPKTGNECDDYNECTAVDSCSDGVCVGSGPVDCDDGNECTDDSCDPGLGCQRLANEVPCNDDDSCSDPDLCSEGLCQGGPPVQCDDENLCTDDACDPATGCTFVHNSVPCNDDNECTVGDVCAAGACTGGPPLDCDDGNGCTDDSCEPGTGCLNAPNGDVCDDENPCTTQDHCEAGGCVGGAPLDCSDNEVCTDDSCDPTVGCKHTSNAEPCDDGNGCSVGDHCLDGTCHAGPDQPDCDDQNPCTNDYCMSPAGCQHGLTTGPLCDDDSLCTTGDHCESGECVAEDVVGCDDGNECTDDSCDPGTGDCLHDPVPDATPCDDSNACTEGDACEDGQCIAGLPVDCDDGNDCTGDQCHPVSGCMNSAVGDGQACTDENSCTSDDRCVEGDCIPSGEVQCDDSIECTNDSCKPSTGECQFEPDDNLCDDANACTENECHPDSGCVDPPHSVECDDANQCTDDTCDPEQGCVFQPAEDGASCSDVDPCTVGDSCLQGSCEPGDAVPPEGYCGETCCLANEVCGPGVECTTCGNSVCDDAEDCLTCPSECSPWGPHVIQLSCNDGQVTGDTADSATLAECNGGNCIDGYDGVEGHHFGPEHAYLLAAPADQHSKVGVDLVKTERGGGILDLILLGKNGCVEPHAPAEFGHMWFGEATVKFVAAPDSRHYLVVDGFCPPVPASEVPCSGSYLLSVTCESACGDGDCASYEDNAACPADCGVCGDGICSADESCTCSTDCGPCCGNGVCAGVETCTTCPADCGSCCGNGKCDNDESVASCPADCHCDNDSQCEQAQGEYCCTCSHDCGECCGNGIEDIEPCGETCYDCPADFGETCCGNSVCDTAAGETCSTCPTDCDECCGDGICSAVTGENCSTCQSDCGDCPQGECGNSTCEPEKGENLSTCPDDCAENKCGNLLCEAWNYGEDCLVCSEDCGLCCPAGVGNGTCDWAFGENVYNCPADCEDVPGCGDSVCDAATETCHSCPFDCGPCCGNASCDPSYGENINSCPEDCEPVSGCGDEVCDEAGGESCDQCSCFRDCCGPCWKSTLEQLYYFVVPVTGSDRCDAQYPLPGLTEDHFGLEDYGEFCVDEDLDYWEGPDDLYWYHHSGDAAEATFSVSGRDAVGHVRGVFVCDRQEAAILACSKTSSGIELVCEDTAGKLSVTWTAMTDKNYFMVVELVPDTDGRYLLSFELEP